MSIALPGFDGDAVEGFPLENEGLPLDVEGLPPASGVNLNAWCTELGPVWVNTKGFREAANAVYFDCIAGKYLDSWAS